MTAAPVGDAFSAWPLRIQAEPWLALQTPAAAGAISNLRFEPQSAGGLAVCGRKRSRAQSRSRTARTCASARGPYIVAAS
jgi:hypothetical protein